MHVSNSWRALLALAVAASTALTLPVVGAWASDGATSGVGADPVLTVNNGAVRGVAVTGGYAFRGLPYAAPPTGHRRWRRPRPQLHGAGSGTRRSTRQAARRSRTCSSRRGLSPRIACI
jgi:para-nitrobenzyl esterase